MSAGVPPGLPRPVAHAVEAGRRLTDAVPGIVAVGLAGSWARGAGRPDSDVDLLVLTTEPGALLHSTAWFAVFGERAELVRSASFGAVEERRLRRPDGLVVEVAVGDPSWAGIDPVDPGTRRVLTDGFAVVYDPAGLLARLVAAVLTADERPTQPRRRAAHPDDDR